jgi:DNA-binding transcriptional regulator GbsR (MarR family)
MALLASDEGALTAAELQEELGASAAAISGAVRYLQNIGFVHRVPVAGSRRDRYELPPDVWFAAISAARPTYSRLADVSETTARAAEGVSQAVVDRFNGMADFYRFVATRIPEIVQEWVAEHNRASTDPTP